MPVARAPAGLHRRRGVQRQHYGTVGLGRAATDHLARGAARRGSQRAQRDVGYRADADLDLRAPRRQRREHHPGVAADVDGIEQHLHGIDLAGVVVRDRQVDDGAGAEPRSSRRADGDQHRPEQARQHRLMGRAAQHRLFGSGADVEFGSGDRAADRHRQGLVRNVDTLVARTDHVDRHQRFPRIRAASDGCDSTRWASSLCTIFRYRRLGALSASAPVNCVMVVTTSSTSSSVKSQVATSRAAAAATTASTPVRASVPSVSCAAAGTRLAASTAVGLIACCSSSSRICSKRGVGGGWVGCRGVPVYRSDGATHGGQHRQGQQPHPEVEVQSRQSHPVDRRIPQRGEGLLVRLEVSLLQPDPRFDPTRRGARHRGLVGVGVHDRFGQPVQRHGAGRAEQGGQQGSRRQRAAAKSSSSGSHTAAAASCSKPVEPQTRSHHS